MDRRIFFWRVVRAADTHNWNVDVGEQLLDHWIVIIGDNAIAQPVFDVFNAGAEVFFNENIPLRLRRLQIFTHALDNLTVIGFVGVE
ncbi:hypothetical protein D3C85_1699930 [compost metagenome]